jgi:hypothetical protein
MVKTNVLAIFFTCKTVSMSTVGLLIACIFTQLLALKSSSIFSSNSLSSIKSLFSKASIPLHAEDNNSTDFSLFVYCVEDMSGGGFNAVFGYENRASERVNLEESYLTPKRPVIHSHFQVELPKNSDYNDPNLIQHVSGPIRYLNSGKDTKAMVVQAENGDNVVWSVKAGGKNVTATASIDYSKKCPENLISKTPPPWQPIEIKSPEKALLNSSEPDSPPTQPLQPAQIEKANSISSLSQDTSSSLPDSTNIGGLDIDTYCQQYVDFSGKKAAAMLAGNTVYNWNCGNLGVDMWQVCREQYQNTQVSASFSDFANPFSWQCEFQGSVLGSLDVDTFCKTKFHSSANYYLKNGEYNVYGFRCGGIPINLSQVCHNQFGDHSQAFYYDFQDPFSLSCFASRELVQVNDTEKLVTAGNEVTLQAKSNEGSQQWIFLHNQVVSQFNCLRSANQSEGSILTALDCNLAPSQIWQLTSSGILQLIGTNLCLWSDGNLGSNMFLKDCAQVQSGGIIAGTISDDGQVINDTPADGDFVSEDEISSEFFLIEILRNDARLARKINEVLVQTTFEARDLIYGPIAFGCKEIKLNCSGKFLQALANLAKLMAAALWGMMKGAGKFVISFLELYKLLFNAKEVLVGLAILMFSSFFIHETVVDFLIDRLDEFNLKNIFEKYEIMGEIVGQVAPDMVLSALSLGGIEIGIVPAIVKIVGEFSRRTQLLPKTLNLAEKLIGKNFQLTKELVIPITKTEAGAGISGDQILKIAKEGSDEAFEDLLQIIKSEHLRSRLALLRKAHRLCSTTQFCSLEKENLLISANKFDRNGLTKAGRSLQKHADRGSTKFTYSSKIPQDLNNQGLKITEEILDDPNTTSILKQSSKYGDIVDIRDSKGRGIRYRYDYEFMGFLD